MDLQQLGRRNVRPPPRLRRQGNRLPMGRPRRHGAVGVMSNWPCDRRSVVLLHLITTIRTPIILPGRAPATTDTIISISTKCSQLSGSSHRYKHTQIYKYVDHAQVAQWTYFSPSQQFSDYLTPPPDDNSDIHTYLSVAPAGDDRCQCHCTDHDFKPPLDLASYWPIHSPTQSHQWPSKCHHIVATPIMGHSCDRCWAATAPSEAAPRTLPTCGNSSATA